VPRRVSLVPTLRLSMERRILPILQGTDFLFADVEERKSRSRERAGF
jgi:hypothetical protein